LIKISKWVGGVGQEKGRIVNPVGFNEVLLLPQACHKTKIPSSFFSTNYTFSISHPPLKSKASAEKFSLAFPFLLYAGDWRGRGRRKRGDFGGRFLWDFGGRFLWDFERESERERERERRGGGEVEGEGEACFIECSGSVTGKTTCDAFNWSTCQRVDSRKHTAY
jgi:hypothetical protein